MLRRLSFPLVLGGSLFATLPAAAFMVGPPSDPYVPAPGLNNSSPGNPSSSNSGTTSEYEMGYDLGYEQGFGRGLNAGVAQCVADPNTCGIALSGSETEPEGQYGESEPNDNSGDADALVEGRSFRGQTFAQEDVDWFSINVPSDNRAMTINFALSQVAAGSLSGWQVTVLNSTGITQAYFDTGMMVVPNTLDGLDYPITLGRSGTYYIVVEPVAGLLNPQPYELTVALDWTPTNEDDGDASDPPRGFFDSESEFNNAPDEADRINEGIPMYGLINLTFNNVAAGEDGYTWAQGGDPDWFRFETDGAEILQLTFCDRQVCSAGNWLVRVFQFDTPPTGDIPDSQQALASFNTTTCGGTPCAPGVAADEPEPWHVGVSERGTYFIRVDHERLLTAPCVGYQIDSNNDGVADGGSCGCLEAGYSCNIDIPNPGDLVEVTTEEYPLCSNGTGGGTSSTCDFGCLSSTAPTPGVIDANANGVQDVGEETTVCGCPPGAAGATGYPCTVTVPNPGGLQTVNTGQAYPPCPDGSGGADDAQCEVGCICNAFGGVVELPTTEDGSIYTSQYNFTLTTNPFAGGL